MTSSPWFRFVVKGLFWPCNVLLLAAVVLAFVPQVLLPLVIDAIDGLAPWGFVSTALVVVVVPVFSVWHAWRHRVHHHEHPLELLSFFCGVELSLLAVTAGRLFGLNALTGAGEMVFSAIVIGGFFAEVRVVLGDRLPPSQLLDGVMNVALVFRALAGLYVGALLASVSLPFLALSVWHLGDFASNASLSMVVLSPLLLWGLALGALVLLLPVAAPLAWLQTARRSSALVRQRWGVDDLLVTTLTPVAACAVSLAVQWTQPHVDALARLSRPVTNDDERRALVADQDRIAHGLVDAYLGRHTYLGDDDSHPWSSVFLWRHAEHPRHPVEWWLADAGLKRPSSIEDDGSRRWPRDDDFGRTLDRVLDFALRTFGRPFFYRGAFDNDAAHARSAYRAFFGRELDRDHAPAVHKALGARWSRDGRIAGFITQGQSRVRLQRQDLTIRNDRAGVVDVEIHDTWVNQTSADEEVVLDFELPESAAVTGLWMGPTERRADAYAHVVSPRGAAQQLYREEVRARRDPALLEQTGPRQYRLRVFPLPANPGHSGREILANGWHQKFAASVHVWVTYEALPDDDGRVPLPRLRERRNGFWDDDTVRHVHFGSDVLGLSSAVDVDADAQDAVDGGEWVQAAGVDLPRLAQATVAARVGDTCAALVPIGPPATPSLAGRNVAVVVDRSLAMAAHKQSLVDAIAVLRATGATLRFTLGTNALRSERAIAVDDYGAADVEKTVFLGAASPKELLTQWILTPRSERTDVVVVLVGGASVDVDTDSVLPLQELRGGALPRTLLVHLDGRMPAGYDDRTLDAIRRSGGTATTDIHDALLRLQDTPWVDGHRFDAHADGDCPSSGPGHAVVARQQILLFDRGGTAPLSALDGLHRLAVEASVTTPYSSLLVLVNERQRARLAQLTRQGDRFEREADDDGQPRNELKFLRARREPRLTSIESLRAPSMADDDGFAAPMVDDERFANDVAAAPPTDADLPRAPARPAETGIAAAMQAELRALDKRAASHPSSGASARRQAYSAAADRKADDDAVAHFESTPPARLAADATTPVTPVTPVSPVTPGTSTEGPTTIEWLWLAAVLGVIGALALGRRRGV